jgi:hypothetical protein
MKRLEAIISVPAFIANVACGGGGSTSPGNQTQAASVPPARSGHAMAYDDARHVVLLYGGAGSTMLGDLWSWDGNRWLRLSTSGPPARDDAVLVFDSRRQRLVLFGGRSGQTLRSDTWEWDGTAWSEKSVSGPDARLHAVGAFDAERGVVRVYGGVGSDDIPRTDTWEWNGTTWTRVSTAGPTDRGSNHMTYDAARQRTMLSAFRRLEPNADRTYPTELWDWTGSSWALAPGTAPSISPIQPIVGLGAGGGVLMFDGGVLQGTTSTWVWQNSAWSRVATTGPSLRNGHALAYDAVRNRVVLFGGFRNGQDFSDTWEWDGSRWTEVTPR